MLYIPPPAELSEVDPRFDGLTQALQMRVVDVLLTVATCPMRLAVDAVLASEQHEEYHNYDKLR